MALAQEGRDELADMAWLGALLSTDGSDDPTRLPASSSGGPLLTSPQHQRALASHAASLKPASSLPSLSSHAQQPSPSPPVQQQATMLDRFDSRRRTSSGPLPPTPLHKDSVDSFAGSSSGVMGSSAPLPRGPNNAVGSPARQSPINHSSSSSHGSFFSAFRRTTSNSHSASGSHVSSSVGRAHSPTTSTGSPPSTAYAIPVIKDEQALSRSRTLAKQLLGPSAGQRRSLSREQLGTTVEEGEEGGRRRAVTAEPSVGGSASRTSGQHHHSSSADSTASGSTSSYGQVRSERATSPLHPQHQQQFQSLHQGQPTAQPPLKSPTYGVFQRDRTISSTTSAPEYFSETGGEALGGGRVVSIDGRLFRFNGAGDRLDLVQMPTGQDARARTSSLQADERPHSSQPSRSPVNLRSQSPLVRSHTPPEIQTLSSKGGTSSAVPVGVVPRTVLDSGSTPSSSASEGFYGDAIRMSTFATDSPGTSSPLRSSFASPPEADPRCPLPSSSKTTADDTPQTLLSPLSASVGESPISSLSTSSAGRGLSPSLSTTEVETVHAAVHGHMGEVGHVVEFNALPSPGQSLLLALEEEPLVEDGRGEARPPLTTRLSTRSDATVSARPTVPLEPISTTTLTPLPFSGRPASRQGGVNSENASKASTPSSIRPTPSPLVIPSSTSESRLSRREYALDPAGGKDDHVPLALLKLQHRDSSPAVLRSPVVDARSTSPSDESPPPSAVDQPPPLPLKSASFSIPASSRSAGLPPSSAQPSTPDEWVSVSAPPLREAGSENRPLDPYEVLSRPMPKELDTSAQMREKLMRSMTGFGKVAKKSARTKMEQVVDAARHQLAAGSPLTAPHLGVSRSSTSPHHPTSLIHPSRSHTHAHPQAHHPHTHTTQDSPLPPTPRESAGGAGYGPPRSPSPMREAASPEVHTSDSLAKRMAEVEDEEERKLAENMFM